MVKYWIFPVNDDTINGVRKKGAEIFSERMADKFWGLKENARNRDLIRSGDKIVFYLAGRDGQVFIGTATLASGFFELTSEDRKRLWHGNFFRATHGVKLKEIKIWKSSKSIRPLIENLELISYPENWGVYLHHSIIPISEKDYNTIVGPENRKSVDLTKTKKVYFLSNTMLKVIEDKDEITEVQTLFKKKLIAVSDKSGIISVGYQGGSEKQKAFWSKKLDIWWVVATSGNRFWNAFGIGEPEWNSGYSHSITCEINPPFQGINRSISGVFARDSNNNLYLLHRGRIGGGRKNIGKNVFANEFRGDWQSVEDGDRISNIALVASFNSPRFPEQVATFVKEIARIKTKATTGISIKIPEPKIKTITFNEEFSGTKKFTSVSREIEAKCDHGIIVNKLAKVFESNGIEVGSTTPIDLFTVDSNSNLVALFEIKTDTSTTRIYEAIGQLFYNSASLNNKCKLVAVFPASLDQGAKNILKKLNIQCLTYRWVDNEPYFDGFSAKNFI